MNKFLKFSTNNYGDVLLRADTLSGIIEIDNDVVLKLLFVDNSGSAGSKVSIGAAAGGAFTADEQATRNVITNALEALFQAGYTKSYIDVEFPGVIIDSIDIIL